MPALLTRPVPAAAFDTLSCQGLPPLLARLFAARGVAARAQLDYDLTRLLPPSQLKNAEAMAVRLADAIASKRTVRQHAYLSTTLEVRDSFVPAQPKRESRPKLQTRSKRSARSKRAA